MRALILFSHGSLLCGSGEALDAHAERLRARGAFDAVAVGYLNYTEPLFADTVDRLAADGAREIVVAPYFLAPGYFVTVSLPQCLDAARSTHPEIEFRVAATLSDTERLARIVDDSADSALPPERWDEPLERASQRCQRRPECPLFTSCAERAASL